MVFLRMDCSGYGLQVIRSPVVQKIIGELQPNPNGKNGHPGQSSSHIVGQLALREVLAISKLLRNKVNFVFVGMKENVEKNRCTAIGCL